MDCSHQALCPWDFLGENTEVGCHFLFQGIFQPMDRTCVKRHFLNRGSADYLERRDSADVKAGLEWCGPRDGEATWEPQRSLRKTEPWLLQVIQG